MHLQAERSLMTAANAISLTCEVIEELAGEDIGESINGKLVNRQLLADMVAAQLATKYQNILMLPVRAA